MIRRSRFRIAVGLLALILAGATLPAAAEQSSHGGVFVAFSGSFAPNQIPRHRLVPISLTLRGGAWKSEGPPPRLQRIELAFGARGGLDTAGLPVCPRSQLRNATQQQALARCRTALVGRGEISAEVPFSQVEPFRARVGLLIFNGRYRGRPAAWVHAYAASPPVSFVLPFYLQRPRNGTYGVLMRSPIGRALGRWPRLRSFQITLGRRYQAQGQTHSYLNAHCPLAPRYTHLSVPFARATFEFVPGPSFTEPIRRSCTVRE
jgi:hypothetical protein